MPLPQIAIIGAGLAGLSCAQALQEAGLAPQVFDKARGPGGRLSSRRRLNTTFDLGCQALSARTVEFAQQLARWEARQWVRPWQKNTWVGAPRMSALTRHLSEPLALKTSTRITQIKQQTPTRWLLQDEQGTTWGPYTHLVIATPAHQASQLLESISPELSAQTGFIQEAPVWVVYFALHQGLAHPSACEHLRQGPLQRITCLNSKQRPDIQSDPETSLQRWVVEATPKWSQQRLDAPPNRVADELYSHWQALQAAKVQAARAQTTKATETPLLLEAHRWLYGLAQNPLQAGFLQDSKHPLYVAGDYCLGQDAEAAWRSGQELGKALRKAVQ